MMPTAGLVVVGVSDGRVCRDQKCSLITYALGSCIAVTAHDPLAGVGALLHFMLPDSSLDRAKAEARPFMFVDTGLPLLLSQVCAAGAQKKRLVVRLAGGAQVIPDARGLFNIGKRNHEAVREALRRAGLPVASEAVGGTESRTVRLEIASGRCWIRESGNGEREWSHACNA
jgi:chemotaxis protein CheD